MAVRDGGQGCNVSPLQKDRAEGKAASPAELTLTSTPLCLTALGGRFDYTVLPFRCDLIKGGINGGRGRERHCFSMPTCSQSPPEKNEMLSRLVFLFFFLFSFAREEKGKELLEE